LAGYIHLFIYLNPATTGNLASFIIKSLEPRQFITFNNTLLFITLKINYYHTVLSFILFFIFLWTTYVL
jgi:hypothetical protein